MGGFFTSCVTDRCLDASVGARQWPAGRALLLSSSPVNGLFGRLLFVFAVRVESFPGLGFV